VSFGRLVTTTASRSGHFDQRESGVPYFWIRFLYAFFYMCLLKVASRKAFPASESGKVVALSINKSSSSSSAGSSQSCSMSSSSSSVSQPRFLCPASPEQMVELPEFCMPLGIPSGELIPTLVDPLLIAFSSGLKRSIVLQVPSLYHFLLY